MVGCAHVMPEEDETAEEVVEGLDKGAAEAVVEGLDKGAEEVVEGRDIATVRSGLVRGDDTEDSARTSEGIIDGEDGGFQGTGGELPS